MPDNGGGNLVSLPDEILHQILRYSEPPGQCLALERTSRRFRNVTNAPLLWRHYCSISFRYWDKRHGIDEKLKQPPATVEWKQLFAQRYVTDRETTRALNDILSSQTGRIRKAQAIINRGYDVKDTLLRHSLAGSDLDDYLARRYFSNAIIGCLQRNIAIPEWAKLRESEDAVSLDRALGSFDLFVPQCEIDSLDDISDMLNVIAENLSRENPNIVDSTPREKALIIASYLLSNNYTGIQAGREYHSLEHNFLGLALRDPHHNSLPLISAAIFCYVAQKFGLNAQPCGFPFHVHVIISPLAGFDMNGHALTDDSGDNAPMYMDPFRAKDEVPVAELQHQLNLFESSTAARSMFLGRSPISEIVVRCGRNILNSLQVPPENAVDFVSRSLDTDSARYAGLWSLMLSAPQARLMDIRRYLPWFMELFFKEFPWDISLVERYILTMFQGLVEYEHVAEGLRVTRAVDEMPKQLRKREAEHKNVKYRVGEVFHHRRYNYQAIITGWDSECGAGEEWMRRMGIDQLQAGRKQSFYHALVEDRSVRYVAEENIQIIRPTMSELPAQLLGIAGKHFKRWSEGERKFAARRQGKSHHPERSQEQTTCRGRSQSEARDYSTDPNARSPFLKRFASRSTYFNPGFYHLSLDCRIAPIQSSQTFKMNSTLFSATPETYWGTFEEVSKYNVHLNVFERLWEAWYAYMQNDVLATGIMSFLMHELVYFGRSLPWVIIDSLGLFRKYKIQGNKIPSAKEQWDCAKLVLLSHFTVELPQIWLFHPMAQYFGLSTTTPFPSLLTMAYQIAIFFVMEDTWHYWLHRALHWGPLYKGIHKIHHQYSAPFGLAAEYASPIEVMLLGFGTVSCPIIWCAFTGDLHILTMYFWIVFRLFQAIDAHSGYEFPWSLHHFLPFWAGADHHDLHHEKFVGNFSSSFRWWDYVLDTEYTPESVKRWREKKQAKKAN